MNLGRLGSAKRPDSFLELCDGIKVVPNMSPGTFVEQMRQEIAEIMSELDDLEPLTIRPAKKFSVKLPKEATLKPASTPRVYTKYIPKKSVSVHQAVNTSARAQAQKMKRWIREEVFVINASDLPSPDYSNAF